MLHSVCDAVCVLQTNTHNILTLPPGNQVSEYQDRETQWTAHVETAVTVHCTMRKEDREAGDTAVDSDSECKPEEEEEERRANVARERWMAKAWDGNENKHPVHLLHTHTVTLRQHENREKV